MTKKKKKKSTLQKHNQENNNKDINKDIIGLSTQIKSLRE